MDIRKLQRAIVDGLEDVKGQNIRVFNTEHLSPLFERVIIASGTSNRQTKALAASVRDAVKSRGMQVMRTEGEDNGEWIIVDCGAAVAHIMQPGIRDYYHLEEIWGGKAVKLKLTDERETRLPKAEEPQDARSAARPAGKTAAKKAPAKKAGATRKVASRTTASTAAKTTPKATAKTGARAPAKTASGAATKSASRAPSKKAAAKKAPARKTVTRTEGTKKPASKTTRRGA